MYFPRPAAWSHLACARGIQFHLRRAVDGLLRGRHAPSHPGTRFSVTFRRLDRSDSPHPSSEHPELATGTYEKTDVLVVEDNPGDVWLLEEAFGHLHHDVSCLRTGRAALDLLGRIQEGDVGQPMLVILDLNLPTVDGFDVLERIKSTDGLQSTPVVVFSGSTSEADIARAYELGANAYLSKPTDVDEHLSTLEALCEFWLSRAHSAQ